MRIIGGDAKGRSIPLPSGCQIRPTAERVKKSLFDILRPITGKSFLDLFAGSGNIGLEALSRGACFANFVERNIRLVKTIQMAVDQLGYSKWAEVINADTERGLDYLFNRGSRFDIIFADPPYDEGLIWRTLQWLGKGDALKSGGIVILQHSVREELKALQVGAYVIEDQRCYGDTMLTFLHKSG